MGNNPSTSSKSPTSNSISSSAQDSPRAPSNWRDPRNLIHPQRTPAEPSLIQTRRIAKTSHRVPSSSHASVTTHTNQSPVCPSPNVVGLGKDLSVGMKQDPKPAMIDEPSKPVDVPVPATNLENDVSRSIIQSFETSGPSTFQDMSYHITRPPRLPLPIEEEVHTPGSPIIAPTDLETPFQDIGSLENDTLARRTSGLSNTTIDEEDVEELRVDRTKATVPITFEWRHGGEKVYVTGTIFQWNKKHRLHPVENHPGLLRAIIHVRPGTHHIRFIKDSVMQCSQDLPTTVDFGNNLVNYIEVSADDIPDDTPLPIKKDTQEDHRALSPDSHSLSIPSESKNLGNVTTTKAPKSKPVPSHDKYTSQIPQYIIDLDKPEDSIEYRNAALAIEKLPTPPSLPGFLGKPILNAATPLKDDNSVLIMPNHSVLNHLATSSIKNNVLAVSATTRYKSKYVTTIMYKPTCDE